MIKFYYCMGFVNNRPVSSFKTVFFIPLTSILLRTLSFDKIFYITSIYIGVSSSENLNILLLKKRRVYRLSLVKAALNIGFININHNITIYL